MKLISMNITVKQNELIELLITLGYYPNRSDCIRSFINLGIENCKETIIFEDCLKKAQEQD